MSASHAPPPPAGYEPGKLDGSIRKYLAVCERTIRHAESLGTQVSAYLKRLAGAPAGNDGAMADANQATILLERLTKAGLNMVKATDELTRLRSFLAGGPDSRPDLTIRGEIELRGIILAAVRDMGWSIMDAKGKPIEIEAA